MKRFSLIFIALISVWVVKSAEDSKTGTAPTELFCTDGVGVFYVSAEKEVTSPVEKTRLRIVRMPDGMLLLDVGQLVYPVIPNVTPVYLSEEDKLVMLPDLEIKDASIGLQLPEGLQDFVNQILHRPPPPQDVTKVLTKADSLAAGMVHRAEVMGGVITAKAAKLQTGDPAAPDSHPRWRAGALYARRATDRALGATIYATNLVGHAIERAGQKVRPVIPFYRKTKTADDDNTGVDGKSVKHTPKLTEDMRAASVKALDKITEALKKSAQIVATSVKENTVKVIQHNFGDDIAEAVEDVAVTVKNTLMARKNINNLQPGSIARNTIRQMITRPNTQDQITCKQDL